MFIGRGIPSSASTPKGCHVRYALERLRLLNPGNFRNHLSGIDTGFNATPTGWTREEGASFSIAMPPLRGGGLVFFVLGLGMPRALRSTPGIPWINRPGIYAGYPKGAGTRGL